MSTVLFTFDNDQQREAFVELLKGFAKTNKTKPAVVGLLSKALSSLKTDPKIRDEKDKIVALFVAGNKIMEDSLPKIRQAFNVEISHHSGDVSIRELVNKKWTTIQSRKTTKR